MQRAGRVPDTKVTRLAQARTADAALRQRESLLQALSVHNHKISETNAVEVVFALPEVLGPFDVAAVVAPDPRVQLLVRGDSPHLAVGASPDGKGGLTLVLIARRV